MKDNGNGFWWIMQRIRGELLATGPYKGKGPAQKHRSRLQGGETWLFWCESDDAETAKAQFRDEEVRKIG